MENKEITLSSGKVVSIKKGKGYDIETTQKLIDGDQSKFMSAFMAQCVSIDGKPVVMEDLREMDADEYLEIMGEFSLINFPSASGK